MAGYFFDDFGFVGGQLASGTRGRELLRLDFLEQLARALHVRLLGPHRYWTGVAWGHGDVTLQRF